MAREMKDSGIEWIGEIPKDWEVGKIKNICNLYVGNSIKDNEKQNYQDSVNAIPYISTKDINVNNAVINYENGMYTKIGDPNFKIAKKSSILLCIEGGSAGKKISYLLQDVSFVNKLCCFEGKENIRKKYLYYFIKSESFKSEFKLNISGLIGGVSQNLLKNFSIVIPNFQEQEKIANYLDKKISDIDLIIEKTKATIEDYKKYKQSIITEVVTKGLNPNVEMKDSGIEWIGKIPKHWEFLRIQNLFEVIDRRNMNPQAQLLSLYTAIGVKPRADLEEKGNKAVTVINYKIVEKNDIIVNKLLAWMGAIAYSDYEGVTSPDYDVYRAKEGKPVNRNYFNNYFRYTQFKGDCFKYGYGIMLMRWRTYSEQFLRLKVPVPPLEEQQQIADYLDKKVSEIDNLIAKKESLISEMEEYKKSLIYECVTGKKEL